MVQQVILMLVLLMGSVAAQDQAQAQQMELKFELPSFTTANYHNPYVAIWIESNKKKETLLLWHLKKGRKDKWLVDIRRWWRKQGRYGTAPDGVTGATKGPDIYKKKFDINDVEQFNLFIEVVREDGGRSLLKQAINVNDQQMVYKIAADKEIGPVTINLGTK